MIARFPNTSCWQQQEFFYGHDVNGHYWSCGVVSINKLSVDTQILDEVTFYLQNLLDEYDPLLLRHCENVAGYAMQLACYLNVPEKDIENLYWAGFFHDIGKTLISRKILLKPERLTNAEYEEVKQHPRLGVHILESFINDNLLCEIKAGILHHHERYDGNGYPHGLQGEAIPLAARILAVADVFDALTSDRPYRNALSTESAITYLISGSGTLFDPSLVSIFRAILGTPVHN